MTNKTKGTLALLPGSYDPLTLGHWDVISRACRMFDRVIVAVMNNDMQRYDSTAKSKDYLFTLEQRVSMATGACRTLENVQVIGSCARLIDLFDELGADVIVKGIRNEADYQYEQQHALWNRAHNERAETMYLPADEAVAHVSSTLVRARLAEGQSIDELVPPAVAEWVRRM